MMPENKSNEFFVDLARDVALRYVIHEESEKQISGLFIQAAKSINWQTVMNSETAAEEVLNHLELHGKIAGLLITLTSSFMFRADLGSVEARYDLASKLAMSVTWPRDAKEMRDMVPRLTATSENARNTFVGCPWMMFLYLLTMSNIVTMLDQARAPKAPAPKPA